MDESDDDATPVTNVDAEINELLGLFDVPAFVRRGQDLEYTLAQVHARCRRERDEMLEMVRLRLRQWSSAAPNADDWAGVFADPIDGFLCACGVDAPSGSGAPSPLRRRRTVARDLVASVERFNRRWGKFLDELSLDHANRQIDLYNRYYILEKECCLGSPRLAARHFTPKPPLTREGLLEFYSFLPTPVLVP